MIGNDRVKYSSSSEWLSAVRQDELWLLQEKRLLSAGSSDKEVIRTKAKERMGDDTVSIYWDLYDHNVEKTIQEAWDTGMSLVKLKIQAISLLTLEWIEQQTGGRPSMNTKDQSSVVVLQLKPIFFGIEEEAKAFLESIQGMKPTQITAKVNQLVGEQKISELSSHRDLWKVLHDNGYYNKTESNWNMQVK